MNHCRSTLRLAAIVSRQWTAILVVCLAMNFASSAWPELSRGLQSTSRSADSQRVVETTNNPDALFGRALRLRTKLTRRDLNESLRLMQESARLYRAHANRQRQALAEIQLGDTYQMMSSFSDAEAAYLRALAASSNLPDLKCKATSQLVRSYANIGSAEKASASIDDAIQICGAVSASALHANLEEARGEAALLSKDKLNAAIYFQHAIELAAENRDRDVEALATLGLAEAEPTDEPGHQRSTILAQSALDKFLALGDEYGAARANSFLGFATAELGDLDRSRCHASAALRVFEQIGDSDNAAATFDALGDEARHSGSFDEAMQDYQQARKLFALVGDSIGEASAIVPISEILVDQKSYTELPMLYSRKQALSISVGVHSLLGSGLIDQAGVDDRAGRYDKADSEYQHALKQYTLDGNGSGEGMVIMRWATSHEEQGDFSAALNLLKQAQTLEEQTGSVFYQAQIEYLTAHVYLKENQLDSALKHIEKCIEIVESKKIHIAQFDSRAQYFASIHAYYELNIEVLMTLARRTSDQNFVRLAFEAAERSKVRALLDSLEGSHDSESCETLIRSSEMPHDRGPDGFESTDLTTLPVLSLPEVQSEISRSNTVLLEYALGESQSYAWLVESDGIKVFNLGPVSDIQHHVAAFRRALIPVVPHPGELVADYLESRQLSAQSWQVEAKAIGNLILAHQTITPGKNLLIVPDGPLNSLPFSVLPIPPDSGTGKVLCQEHTITILPSASVLAAIRKKAAQRPRPRDEVTVFADPLFERPRAPATAKELQPRTVPVSRDLELALRDSIGSSAIPSLPGSRSEARAIESLLGPARTHLLLGAKANRDAVSSASLGQQQIIHFATHGIIDSQHPERSGLVLSLFNDHGKPTDGYVRLSDIYALKLSADLVVLSSCDSALGKDLGSEGIIGLPRAFLFAGARRVVASLWKVDDEATELFMKAFYSRLQENQAPAQALQGAQLELMKNNRFSEPFYWAAFVLEGDYK